MYAKVVAVYSPDADAVFTVGMDYYMIHDIRMTEDIWDRITDSGLFDRLVDDKGFDSSKLIMHAAKRHWCYVSMCVAAGLGLGPVSVCCPRETIMFGAERGNVRSLVESLFCSVKAFSCGFVCLFLRVLRLGSL